MTEFPTEWQTIEEDIVLLLKRLSSELPSGVATLRILPTTPPGYGVAVSLEPQNPEAAAVWMHARSGFGRVDFGFGLWGPTWELPVEGENPAAIKKEVLAELEQMCRAVVQGHCSHKRGFISITGRLTVGDRPYRITDLLVFRPKPPRAEYTRTRHISLTKPEEYLRRVTDSASD